MLHFAFFVITYIEYFSFCSAPYSKTLGASFGTTTTIFSSLSLILKIELYVQPPQQYENIANSSNIESSG